MPEIIWEGRFDDRYQCRVTRKGDYQGILTVTDEQTKEQLLEEEVSLSYGAIVGPDIFDVQEWQSRSTEIVDEREAKSRGS